MVSTDPLGWLQMPLVAAAIGALLTTAPNRITYGCVAAASASTLASRLLYRGRPDPTLGVERMMTKHDTQPFKILFLCTGNSARSIFGEYLIKRIGADRFESYSAGADPTGAVNPFAVKVLSELYHIDASEARSKSWEEYKNIKFDFVITVCDNARESCPFWPGQPIIAHWGVPDPALAKGTEAEKFQEFRKAALLLQRRIELFCSLPFEKLDRLKLIALVKDIGEP